MTNLKPITRTLILTLALIVCCMPAHGKIDLKYLQLNTDVGMPSNYIIKMVQDPQGYIWLATANGLCRYDGYAFNVIRHHKNTNDSLLLNNRIRDLYQNPNGLLFIRLQGEQYSCYDTYKRRFLDFTTTNHFTRNYDVCTFTSDSTSWLTFRFTGCLEIKYKNGKLDVSEYSKENGKLKSNGIKFVEEDEKKRVWIGTDKGLYMKEGDNFKCIDSERWFEYGNYCLGKMYFITADNHLLHADEQGNLHEDAGPLNQMLSTNDLKGVTHIGKKLLLITSGKTLSFDPSNGNMTPSDLQMPNGILVKDNLGNDYIGDDAGQITYIDRKTRHTHQFDVLTPNLMKYRGFREYQVLTAANGMIWISTMGNGLFVYDPSKDQLDHLSPREIGVSPISTDNLYYIMEDNSGNIWVAQEFMGLSVITTIPAVVERVYAKENSSPAYENLFRILRKTSDGRIWTSNMAKGTYAMDKEMKLKNIDIGVKDDMLSIYRDSKGHLWQGTRNKGISVDGRFYHNDPSDSTSIAPGKVFDIIGDKKGRIWLAVNTGALCLAIPQADGSYRFRRFLDNDLFMRALTTFCVTKEGNIYIGCANGFVVFNPDKLIKDPTAFHYYNSRNSELGYYEVRDILLDNDNVVWMATSGGGLYRIGNPDDIENLSFTQYTTENGLADNVANSLVMDSNGILWIGTNYGLSRLQIEQMLFQTFFLSSNKLGEVYSEHSACCSDNGLLVFATNDGIVYFNPNDLPSSINQAGELNITDLLVNGLAYNDFQEDEGLERKVRLKHNQNSLVFRFSDMKYEFPHRTEYVYMLEGKDNKWSLPTRDNEAVYKELQPGHYVFHLRRSGNSTHELTMEVIILQPLWNTWWAWCIYLLFAGALVWYVTRLLLITYKMRNRIKMDKQISEFKQRFFMDVSHEFRTPLTLIQGSMERIRKAGEMPAALRLPLSNMGKSTDRLMRLINQLLEYHKLSSGKLQLKLQQTDVVILLRDITSTFTDMAHNREINLQFVPFKHHFEMYVDRSKLDKIFYNLLSNAFKYTPHKGDITVRVKEDKDKGLIIKVEDTGIGVSKDMQDKLFTRFLQNDLQADSMGIGLHFTEQLVLALHGTIRYDDNPGGGSIFSVTLPTDTNVYQPEDFMRESSTGKESEMEEQTKASIAEYKELDLQPLNDRIVLIVEDDNDVREYIRNELAAYFIVRTSQDGEDGLEQIQKERPDLIISDIKMPRMNGIELLKKVRADDNLFDIPFILLTALGSDEKKLQGMRYGADSYIPKPFSPTLLISRSISLIQQYEKLKKLYAKASKGDTNKPASEKETTSPIISNPQDKKFHNIIDIKIDSRLSDPSFVVEELAQAVGYSRSQLYNKMMEITGKTPKEYIRDRRMNKAAALLRETYNVNISEVAYQVGFSDPLYFSRCFKQYFGMTPSKYQKGKAE